MKKKRKVEEYKAAASALLKRYRDEAGLVITTALHCAQPCAALGIPVVFVDPNYDEAERFSSMNGILPRYSLDDLKDARVDFSPKRITTLRKKLVLRNKENAR